MFNQRPSATVDMLPPGSKIEQLSNLLQHSNHNLTTFRPHDPWPLLFMCCRGEIWSQCLECGTPEVILLQISQLNYTQRRHLAVFWRLQPLSSPGEPPAWMWGIGHAWVNTVAVTAHSSCTCWTGGHRLCIAVTHAEFKWSQFLVGHSGVSTRL